MITILKHYYNLSFLKKQEYNSYMILECHDGVYIFKKIMQNEEQIFKIYKLLEKNKCSYHEIIPNIQNRIITTHLDKIYILLKLKNPTYLVGDDINLVLADLTENDIVGLWERKIEYYMQQIRELGLNKNILINSLNYYIGMAENAIAVLKKTSLNEGKVYYSISHRRMYYPNYNINYSDPTNILVDIRVRDIAEYIKAQFFSDDIDIVYAIEFINKYQFTDKEINILFSRLLYPTYYFDVFEELIVEETASYENIVKIIKKRKKYEKFLSDLNFFYKKNNHSIVEILWLNNQ